jgi:superfamily II DNA/RNA helicase
LPNLLLLQILVASDVASRGLDIRGLPYVVQYDFPSNLETYIHRVGRTGRLAAQGHAYSFFTRSLVRNISKWSVGYRFYGGL